MLFRGLRVIADGRDSSDAWVYVIGDRIAASGVGEPPTELLSGEIVDAAVLGAGILTPGFVDIHVHGAGGYAYDDGADAIRAARAVHRSHGTTRSVLSLVTGSLDALMERVRVIAELTREDPEILGSHLEGPFLDVGHKGAHTASLLRDPTAEAIEQLFEAGEGTIRQVTLAPELPGGLDAIRRVVGHGAAAAVGHTAADRAQTQAAFDAGATILTHAFNAMKGLHHREPGPVGAALSDPRVRLEVIADGVHVHADVIRMLGVSAPGRVALVTDAMAAAGAADGAYELGGLAVEVLDGVARLVEGGAIAGSTLTQDAALRTAVAAGMPLAAAVEALTSVPAAAVGRADLGTLEVGALADIVLLDDDLHVRGVWIAGTRV